jgi:glycosyltransferase involved in cell wall biosynthesis
MKLVRILVLSNKCPPDYDGGYELSAFQVAGALRQRGYDVQLLTSHYRPTFKGSRDTDPDWVHRVFEYSEWPNLMKNGLVRFSEDVERVTRLTQIGVANAGVLDAYLAKHEVDLAYCFGLHGIGLATAYPLAQRKIPILWHAGNYLIAQDLQLKSMFGRRRAAHRFAMHVKARRAKSMIMKGDYSHIAFLSQAMNKEFVKMGYEPPRSYVIPRGIDFPLAIDTSMPRDKTFLMASRIGPEKGYDVVLNAVGQLAKMTPQPWTLKIAGSGSADYIESLKSNAKSLGISDSVQFLGMLKREEVLDEMRRAYAFISASLWEEPFGRTNIESLACGAALIAADAGAIREIVGDSGCARIYEKQNAEALAKIMDELLSNPAERTQLAAKGIHRIEDAYSLDRILDMTETVFEQVMKDYGKPFVKPTRPGGRA